jgi:segregation and condensation protein B
MENDMQIPTSDDQVPDPGTGRPVDPALTEMIATVEAILFASDSPLTVSKIGSVAELTPGAVGKAITALNERYAEGTSAFRIEPIANGYQMLTLPEYQDVLSRLLRTKSQSRLSQAAMETLAIVAYRQPIMRADIEAIRGVACGDLLRGLMEKGLIKIVGRAEVLGRPMLYGTTRRFLEVFGLGALDDLPRVEELRSGAPEAGRSGPPKSEDPPAPAQTDPSVEAPDPGDSDADDAPNPTP